MSSAAKYLIELVFDLATLLFLARFVIQACRVNFYNPVSQGIVKISDPVLKPLRFVLPSYRNLDFASFFAAALVIFIKLYVLFSSTSLGLLIGYSALQALLLLLTFFKYAVFGVVLLSFLVLLGFVNYNNPHPLIVLLHEITEPLMAPIRRLMPDMGGIDFSPMLLLVGLHVAGLVLQDLFGRVVGAFV